jgi:hypothetical protein
VIFDDNELDELERVGSGLVDGLLVLAGVGFFLAVFLLWY